ncbi:hypothetical protein [Erythrobacter sp. NFXS35]|uniref:hypothetical protein n=1 Tax=Erythrobacter sp. NFXS35 TaxID=2818436 RepID=UPI0032DE7BE3
MSEAGFASLGPMLLARKGGAKPAMRPQVAPLVADEAEIAALADEQLEDLGWNDMGDGGDDSDNENGADVVPINAAVAASESATSESPIIRRQQRRLEERVLAEAVMTGPEDESEETSDLSATDADYDNAGEEGYDEAEEDGEAFDDEYSEAAYAPIAPTPAATPVVRKVPAQRVLNRTAQSTNERRAAFTLRLDPERHLKLRLAATMQGVSAQVLLTEALDAMLAQYDDLDVIAAHLKRH